MTFLENLMFSRLDKFHGPILGWGGRGGGSVSVYMGGLIFGMLIRLHYISGGAYIQGSLHKGVLRDFTVCHQFCFNKMTTRISFYCDNIFLYPVISFYIYESLTRK